MISCIKYCKDKESFKLLKEMGINIVELQDMNNVDNKMRDLINSNYRTIILSNEVASFSEDIVKKYSKNEDVSIIIASGKYI